MSKFFLSVAIIALFSHLAQGQPKDLFNGKDLSGWHIDVPDMDKDPKLKSPFLVRNGLLVSLGTPGGHLITDEVFENYRLEVEYRFAGKPGCNRVSSAIVFRAAVKLAARWLCPEGVRVHPGLHDHVHPAPEIPG